MLVTLYNSLEDTSVRNMLVKAVCLPIDNRTVASYTVASFATTKTKQTSIFKKSLINPLKPHFC